MEPSMSEEVEVRGQLSDQDRRAVETLYRAFSEHDPDLLDQAVTDDWEDIPLAPGQAPGRGGTKPLMRSFSAAFPDARVTIHEIIGIAGKAAVRAEITGTHRGEWFGVKPTGKSFKLPLHEFHHVENGRIFRTWHMEDWFGWLHQVGAMGTDQDGGVAD